MRSLEVLFIAVPCLTAQNNYEIQVYGSETLRSGYTMLELHNVFIFQGTKETVNGVLQTNHVLHETVEITHGWNNWFETALYIFTSAREPYGWQWVGNHIRPRVRVPDSWGWPVGVGLSTELGYQRRQFSVDTWTWEIRPIVDKQLGKLYWSINPVLDRAWHGQGVNQGTVFSPDLKVSYEIIKRIDFGFEYYGSVGPVTGFDALPDQQHQIFPTIDLNLGPNWEFNLGVGVGLTRSTDHLLVKMILGRRFDFGHGRPNNMPRRSPGGR
jgi:hypothetical protein